MGSVEVCENCDVFGLCEGKGYGRTVNLNDMFITLIYSGCPTESHSVPLGSLVLLVMIPLQTFMVTRMRNLSKEGLQRTDRRIGLMNEILSAMDIVKCYAWENSFRTKVLNIRDDEISWFRKAQLLSAVNTFCLNSVPILVTVLAFGFFTYFGAILTPAKAFTSLSLFAVLRFPLFMFPTLVTAAGNVNVFLMRLHDLLRLGGDDWHIHDKKLEHMSLKKLFLIHLIFIPMHAKSLLHCISRDFHNITLSTNSLQSHVEINTRDLFIITCILVTQGVTIKGAECSFLQLILLLVLIILPWFQKNFSL